MWLPLLAFLILHIKVREFYHYAHKILAVRIHI